MRKQDILNVMQREMLCSEHAARCFLEAKRRANKRKARKQKGQP